MGKVPKCAAEFPAAPIKSTPWSSRARPFILLGPLLCALEAESQLANLLWIIPKYSQWSSGGTSISLFP